MSLYCNNKSKYNNACNSRYCPCEEYSCDNMNNDKDCEKSNYCEVICDSKKFPCLNKKVTTYNLPCKKDKRCSDVQIEGADTSKVYYWHRENEFLNDIRPNECLFNGAFFPPNITKRPLRNTARVPGPYPYQNEYPGFNFSYGGDWCAWGGDPLFLGIGRYSAFISDFGHKHIAMITEWANRKVSCKETKAYEELHHYLHEASTSIFEWFVGLRNALDNDLNVPQNDLQKTALKFIEGPGFPLTAEQIDEFFMDNDLGTANEFLGLEFKGEELTNWLELVTTHTRAVRNTLMPYARIYRKANSGQSLAQDREELNYWWTESRKHAPRLAAFFILFFIFMQKSTDDPALNGGQPYTITVNGEERRYITKSEVQNMATNLKYHWREHIYYFDDYMKAIALDDQEGIFQTELYITESCARVAIYIGYIFYKFDRWIRGTQSEECPDPFPPDENGL